MHGFNLETKPLTIPQIPCVYKITNVVNGKVYVGQTINFRSRFYSYRSATGKAVIYRAIRKYGRDKFVIEPIMFPNIDKLNEEELFAIRFCKSADKKIGYNVAESPYLRDNKHLKSSKKVINTETGVIYKSAREAADTEGIKAKTLTSYLRGEYTNKTKLRYL